MESKTVYTISTDDKECGLGGHWLNIADAREALWTARDSGVYRAEDMHIKIVSRSLYKPGVDRNGAEYKTISQLPAPAVRKGSPLSSRVRL